MRSTLTTAEAASRMSLSIREVKRLCKEGLLPAKKDRWGRYEIAEQAADAYRPARRGPKGPRKAPMISTKPGV